MNDDTSDPSAGTTPPAMPGRAPAGTAPRAGGIDGFFAWLRSLDVRRDTDHKWIGGVCSGLGERFGVDPIVVRLVVIVLVFFAGFGIAAYLVAWVLIPNRADEIVAERGLRGGEVGPLLLSLLAAVALAGLIVRGPSEWFGGWNWAPFWLVAIPVALVIWLVSRNRSQDWQTAPAPPATAMPPAPTDMSSTPPTGSTDPATASGWSAMNTTPETTAAPTSPAQPVPAYQAPPPGQVPPAGPSRPAYGPPPPPAPPRPRVPRAGFLATVVTGGVALVVYGILTLLHDQLDWPGSSHVVALAGALTVFGLATLGFGIAGLRAGLTGVIAVILALVTWATAVAPTVNFAGGVGDRYWQPVLAGSQTYQLGVGNATLDLSSYPAPTTSSGDIQVSIGAGDLRILMPSDLTVQVDGTVKAGTITVNGVDLGQADARSGPRVEVHQTFGAPPTAVVVTANVGAGQIQIVKE